MKDFKKQLNPEEKEALNRSYTSFKRYVIDYNPELSVLIDNYFSTNSDPKFTIDDLTLMKTHVKNLCEKDIATFSSYVTIAEKRLADIPKHIKGDLFALDTKRQHSILSVNEMEWLVEQRLLKKETKCRKEFIDDLAALTVENRAELYNYHTIRTLTLTHLKKEIDEFVNSYSANDCFLKPESIKAVIKKYRLIQPYLVDAMKAPEQKKLDADFVEQLNQLSKSKEINPNFFIDLGAINAGIEVLKKQLDTEIGHSNLRKRLFYEPYEQVRQRKSLEELGGGTLTLESELVQRKDKWIRHERLSTASDRMKKTLLQTVKQFDDSLKLPKEFTCDTVPFPEMEDSLDALTVPSQVSWVKRMLNITHYIHKNFKYLESLGKNDYRNDTLSSILNGPLVEGIYQITPFVELTKAYQTLTELMKEPVGQVMYNIVRNGYEDLMSAWNTLKPLYFDSSDEMKTSNPKPISSTDEDQTSNQKSIKSSGLWYSLVALLVVPEQLTALSKGNKYHHQEAKKTQEKAKEMAQFIEDITDKYQSGSYFNLLMKSRYIFAQFLPELREKINRLRADTHGITTKHLRDIQHCLQSLVLETDSLEVKFGLCAGVLSNPTKLIVDQLFNSFIEPLGINLGESVKLIKDESIYNERINANQLKENETSRMLTNEKESFNKIDEFLRALETIKAKLDAKIEISSDEREKFKEHYWKIYPRIQAQQSHYVISMNQKDKSIELDIFCEACFKEKLEIEAANGHYRYNSLKDIMFLTKHVHAAKKGNINSLKMRSDYLKAQSKKIETAKINFNKIDAKNNLKACISAAIDVKIDLICKKASHSVYLEDEFRNTLLECLSAKKEEILKNFDEKYISELIETVDDEIDKQFELFTETSYAKLCHLDRIINQIARFQAYCQNESLNPVYENTDPIIGTLQKKTILLNNLKTIASDHKKSLEDRIQEIRSVAKNELFYTTLMAHDKHFHFDIKTFRRMFLSLFYSIFNFSGESYRPSDFYNSLDKVIKEEQSVVDKSLLSKAGFFARGKSKKTSEQTIEATLDIRPVNQM